MRITLVPGTWAYGFFRFGESRFKPATNPRWFEENAAFRKELEEALTQKGISFTTEVLEWDCSNSVRSRAAQAERLAKLLTAQRGAGVRRIVIAHSHGGNIACKAAGSIEADPSDLALVTLSTPFLQAGEREEESPRYVLGALFVLVAFLCFGAFEFTSGEAAVGPALWNYARGTLLALPLMAAYLWFAISDPEEMTRLVNYPRVVNAKLLVVRGFSDEAGSAIVIGSIGTGLMNTFLYLLAFPLRWMIRSTSRMWLTALAATFALGAFLANAPALFQVVSIWLVIGTMLALLLAPVVLAGMCSSFFGREMFFQCLNLALTVDSVPDCAGTADVVTLSAVQTSAKGLRHGIYNHPWCPSTVADWLAPAGPDRPTSIAGS